MMWSKIATLVGTVLAAVLSSLLSTWQSRTDQRQLGEDDAERVTDTAIDQMEAAQDAVDSMDRGGAAGVLARLHNNSTTAGPNGQH